MSYIFKIKVIKFDFQSKGSGKTFSGTLAEIVGLKNLKVLEIREASMSGTLAPLVVLTKLKALQLDLCGFVGDLEPLRGLTNLEELSLEYNTGIAGKNVLWDSSKKKKSVLFMRFLIVK